MDSIETKPSPPSHQQLQAPTLGIGQNQNPQQQQPENRKRDSDGHGEVGDIGGGGNADPSAKRCTARPPRSGERQLGALEGCGFTPLLIEVEKGEDIVSKVMEFSDQGQQSVFVLSASGAVSRVMLRGTDDAYERRCQITALSGSFVNRIGSLTVAFARPDGHVVGGTVIGSLIAATKVLVIASILLETKRSPLPYGIEQYRNPQQQQPENRKRDSDGEVGDSGGGGNANSDDPAAKRCSGRPPRSGEKHLDTSGRLTKGLSLPPHVIEVEVEIGEDIASKLKELSDQGPRSVSIICARGSISSVTLSGNAAYEGRFLIVTLSGSFVSRSGNLTLAFVGPYGELITGVVIGSLVAATKVQVLVESILLETKNSGGPNQEPASEAANRLITGLARKDHSTEQNESCNNDISTQPFQLWKNSLVR